ncbi:putative Longin domain-containing protein [Helianthus annuus]|nr:putative Longin domain-containing protein [Helianthus annuus]
MAGDSDMNVSFSQDRYIFHVKRNDGLTVLCMADDVSGTQIVLAVYWGQRPSWPNKFTILFHFKIMILPSV